MFFWSKFPFVRIALFIILGILLGIFLPELTIVIASILIILLALLVLLSIRKKAFLVKYNAIYGAIFSLVFLSIGFMFLINSNERNNPDHIIKLESVETYSARVISEPLLKGKFLRMKVEVEAIRNENWQAASGKVFLYIQTPVQESIEIGDRIMIKGPPQLVRPPSNPKEFDYRKFLAYNNIHHQQFVSRGQWRIIEKNADFSLYGASIKARNILEDILTKYVSGGEELAIAKALILGNKEDLGKPIKDTYATAGAMHVLAVSGLHVGIIYMVLLFILGQRKSNGTYPAWVTVLIILVLWLYAFITGLSPSVLRAVTMFSFLALAQTFGRKSNSINTLAISAIILLLINPYLLMNVGFQLSYVAVVGIILLYPKINNWVTPSHWLLKMVWQITVISLVAQLVTAPLSAYYFHRFPTYFFISNLIVIPIASLVVWGGLSLLVFGSITSTIGVIIGGGLEILIHGLNASLHWISWLPGADIHDLAPNFLDTLLIYGVITFLSLYFIFKRLHYLRLSVVFVFLFALGLILADIQNRSLRQIVFYSVSHSWAIDFIENKEFLSIADSLLYTDPKKVDYQIVPNRRYYNLTSSNYSVTTRRISNLGLITVWHGKRILLADPCIKVDEIPGDFDFVLYRTDQSDANCYQEQILLRKLVNIEGTFYQAHNLRLDGALIVNI